MPYTEPAESPLKPIKELDRGSKPRIRKRPKHHYTALSGEGIHEDVQIVGQQANKEPQPKIRTIDAMEYDCQHEGDRNRKKKTMGKVVVIPLHIPENKSRNHIQVGQERQASDQDHLQRQFPTLSRLRR